jgi:hypothetical protein
MMFGDSVQPATTVAPAGWIRGACRGEWGTVGALVPHGYAAVVRVTAPGPGIDDWWAAYRQLFATIAAVGERHTSSPDRAWFAVWEGHGFDTRATMVAWREPVDEATRQALRRRQAALREEDEHRNAVVRRELAQIPRLLLPNRAYYLLRGPVAAATQMHDPGSPNEWRRPDLCWPDDRRWFVATDVDFWSVYVAGTDELVAEIARRVPTPASTVTLGDRLEPED